MSGITQINHSLTQDYRRLSSGKRVQTAADGAAEMAISQKQNMAIKSYDVGANNIKDGQSMINVADGAASGVTDALQRMRELAVKASNGTMSASDKESIQQEVDQLKQQIQSTADNTKFNEKKVLDGSEKNINIAMGEAGNKSISMGNTTLEQLGIADFDVTKDFDISKIDDAISKVSSQRSAMGAQHNALEHAYNNSKIASFNLTAADSRSVDLDYGKAVTEKKTKEALREYAVFTQKNVMESKKNLMINLLG